MNRNCNCIIRADSVTLRNGEYTVTLPDGSLTGLCECDAVDIGIYTSVPLDSECNTVEVTDGTTTLSVYECRQCSPCGCGHIAEPWRTTLRCRTVLRTLYTASGHNLTIQRVSGRGCCR